MVRETACRNILITVCFLLGLTALGGAQSDKHRQAGPRSVTVVPATLTASPSDRRVALVIGNGAYRYSPLDNSVNDAQDICAGFSKTCGSRLSSRRMRISRQWLRQSFGLVKVSREAA